MKSKKFDAHEKHFKEKEVKLNREINHLHNRCSELNNENAQLTKKNEQLEKNLLEINEKYEKLLEYANLSDEDIKETLKKDKTINQISALMNIMPKFI